MTQANHQIRARLPRGVPKGTPVHMRLTAEEREQLETLAQQDQRSTSNMARIIYLRGLEAFSLEAAE